MMNEKLSEECISWLLEWAGINNPDLIILYGSFLYDENPEDIDALIVSDDFHSIDYTKRRELLSIPDKYKSSLDVLLMSTNEWGKNIEIETPFSNSIFQLFRCIYRRQRRKD